MHNPWTGKAWPLVCDWSCHIARGSAGGDDFGVEVGTPIIAAFSGTVRNRVTPTPGSYPDGSGPYPVLNTIILTSDGDTRLAFYHLHASRFVTAGHYDEGDVIGYSGGQKHVAGSGTASGPHLHVNAFYGSTIHSIYDYFTAVASSDENPIHVTLVPNYERFPDDMKLIGTTGGTGILISDKGQTAVSLQEYNLFWRVINSDQHKSPFNKPADGWPDTFGQAEVEIMGAALARCK